MASVAKMQVREFLAAAAVLAFAALAYGDTAIELTNGVPVSGLSGAADTQVYYRIAVPSGQSELTISISGGTGDCDLYVKRGTPPSNWNYDYRPYQLGNDETVTVNHPAADDWFIMLRGHDAYTGVTLVASYEPPVPIALTNGVSRTGISGHDHSVRFYSIDVPAGQASLEVNTWGGTGDVDLFVKLGSTPTPSDADAESTDSGTTESVTISSPTAGTWYIALYGADDYEDVGLRALYGSGGSASQGDFDEAISGLSGAAGSESYYVFHVPTNVEYLTFAISGGVGDCDMYIKFGAKPTVSDYDMQPTDDGNSESVGFSGDIESGDYYVLLYGDQDYGDVTLKVHYEYRSPKPPAQKPPEELPKEKVTPLMPGVAVPDLAGSAGSQQYFSIQVPSGASNLVIRISEGTGDADLYVRKGELPTTADYDARPYLTGNNEQVTIGKPAAGVWYVMVRGYYAFAGVTLVASYDGTRPDDVLRLQNGVPITGLAGGQGSEQFFQIEVPAGQSRLEILMSGGIGDADLYIRYGAKPTTREWDWRPYLFGNKESGTSDNPKAGTYYIMIRGYLAYVGVTLQATYGPGVDTVKTLKSCLPVEGLSGAQDSETFFKIEVPAGQAGLRIAISGGTGDADLYVKKGEKPTVRSFDYHPGLHGNDESVEVLSPAATTWYIMVQGYQAYSGVTLKACLLGTHADGCGCGDPGCGHDGGCDTCGDHHCGEPDDCNPEDGCWIIYF